MIPAHETYTLNVPFSHQGRDYTELQVRRMKAKDILRRVNEGENVPPQESNARQMVDLCEVPREVINELDASDFIAIQIIMGSFQNPGEAEVRKAIIMLAGHTGWDLDTLSDMTYEEIVEWLNTLDAIKPKSKR